MQQEMEYVYQVYQYKSFTKAAEKYSISQPALSIAIRKVEDHLGMPIFDRSTRPLSLTVAGQAYMDYILQTRYLEQELTQQMEDIRSVNTGTIRMGGSHYLNAYILPKILFGFSKKFPNVKLEVVERSSSELSAMLAQRELDLTFNCNPRFMKNFERYPAFTDHILLGVPKIFPINRELTGQALSATDIMEKKHLKPDCPVISLKQFQTVDFILLNPGNNLYDRTEQLFAEAGFQPQVRLELSQLVTAYHMADAALGATFVSDRIIVPVKDQLNYYKLNSDLTERTFYILLPNRNYTSQAVKAFIKYFGDSISTI